LRRCRWQAKDSDGGETGITAQRPTRIPEIAPEVINEVHVAHIAAFLLSLLRSIHRAEGGATSFFRGQTPGDFQLCPVFDVKLKLFFQLPLDPIPLE